jgi:predicted dehydrogenase
MAIPPCKIRVGIVGGGEVAQVIHIPTLQLLSHLYTVSAICDLCPKTVEHCAAKFQIPKSTTMPDEIFQDSNVDVVFILTSDEFHAPLTIAALRAGKNVVLEKPMTLSLLSAEKIMEAEKAANGPRVFVGYMRRYAPSFVEVFKREIASIPRILYARSRDIVGPNALFVGQSGTFPVKESDFAPASSDVRARLLDDLFKECFGESAISVIKQKYCRFLGSLGSHDLSLMREALGGLPFAIGGVSLNDPFYSAIFHYRNKDGSPFAVTYESGIDNVPRFDAHLAVYGQDKTVSIQYDTPYIKGLPINVRVEETDGNGHAVCREVLCSFQDAYTSEFMEVHDCFVGLKEIKTSAKDAYEDLKLFDMMYKKYEADLVADNYR